MAGFSRGGGGAGYDRTAYGSSGNPTPGGGRSAYGASGGGGAGYASGGGGAGYGGAGYGSGGGAGAGYSSGGASDAYGGRSARKPAPSGYPDEKASYNPSQHAAGGGGGGASGHLVVKCPEPLILSNCLAVNAQEWGSTQYVIVDGRFVFTAAADKTGQVQSGTLGTALLQRQWAGLSAQGHVVRAEPYDPYSQGPAVYLASLDVEVGFLRKGTEIAEVFDADEMQRNWVRAFEHHIFSIGQLLVFEFHGQNLKATVTGVEVVETQPKRQGAGAPPPPPSQHRSDKGILMRETSVNFIKAGDSGVKIKASGKRAPPNAILQPNFKFEDMGIGGLDSEFSAIFRRAFASRIFPPALVDKLGIQHVKGILLYGPPGTGKTLMARQIGKMLNANEPKIVNGPEILNKYVGASEENIRKLFADAEKEYKAKGDESGLHIIIFDELDAICKQRGSSGGGTGVGDSVVNQLLSKMDGVDQLNNILLIGMTNRLDMIDDALLRPGRLEVHMEINLPDEYGRRQIISIQTSKMRTNGVMDDDVDLAELAALTKNFSGAEIAGLVKSATSFAFNRHVKVGTMAGISDDVEGMRVNRDDFLHALDEVTPAFGVAEEELQQVVSNGIMHYAPHIDVILRDGQLRVEQVRTSSRTPLVTALLHGPPGSGKTALAATMAMASSFPFIKLVSPENMVGMAESQKIAYLNKVFNDSYKSPLSIIVVDSIEKIVEWVPIGPRFSNPVLQALSVLLGKRPPKDRRLLILATTSNRPMLVDMDLAEAFLADIRVPAITSLRSVDHVVRETGLFRDQSEQDRLMGLLRSAGLEDSNRLNIGIKKLLSEIEMARLDEDPADKLTAALNSL
ncbi:AAA-domain-containing protein [Ceraceosorus guamensis]|uniref:Vesicular-fusion protein SEC18 n=1 Tax=Ceraceosorus guamensis TaxID=1522189 RepID=A0A316VV56_9BASI|nr:AAA-domain-containing protein [Ceraceosorus guamensis]PWN41506.1 AAA-domain-containing protein [Ceraceosorus guamensis]